jgi:hypothetical protein
MERHESVEPDAAIVGRPQKATPCVAPQQAAFFVVFSPARNAWREPGSNGCCGAGKFRSRPKRTEGDSKPTREVDEKVLALLFTSARVTPKQ